MLFLLTLVFLLPPLLSASNFQYVTYQPAVTIINIGSFPNPSPSPSSPNTSPQPPNTSPQQSSLPFSPAKPPACPANTISCDSIGEPSWCCTPAQHCAFDEGGDISCCPTGDFCRGRVDYGLVNDGGGGASDSGSGSGSGSGTGGGSENGGSSQQSGSGNSNTGPVTITNAAASRSEISVYWTLRLSSLIISGVAWL